MLGDFRLTSHLLDEQMMHLFMTCENTTMRCMTQNPNANLLVLEQLVLQTIFQIKVQL